MIVKQSVTRLALVAVVFTPWPVPFVFSQEQHHVRVHSSLGDPHVGASEGQSFVGVEASLGEEGHHVAASDGTVLFHREVVEDIMVGVDVDLSANLLDEVDQVFVDGSVDGDDGVDPDEASDMEAKTRKLAKGSKNNPVLHPSWAPISTDLVSSELKECIDKLNGVYTFACCCSGGVFQATFDCQGHLCGYHEIEIAPSSTYPFAASEEETSDCVFSGTFDAREVIDPTNCNMKNDLMFIPANYQRDSCYEISDGHDAPGPTLGELPIPQENHSDPVGFRFKLVNGSNDLELTFLRADTEPKQASSSELANNSGVGSRRIVDAIHYSRNPTHGRILATAISNDKLDEVVTMHSRRLECTDPRLCRSNDILVRLSDFQLDITGPTPSPTDLPIPSASPSLSPTITICNNNNRQLLEAAVTYGSIVAGALTGGLASSLITQLAGDTLLTTIELLCENNGVPTPTLLFNDVRNIARDTTEIVMVEDIVRALRVTIQQIKDESEGNEGTPPGTVTGIPFPDLLARARNLEVDEARAAGLGSHGIRVTLTLATLKFQLLNLYVNIARANGDRACCALAATDYSRMIRNTRNYFGAFRREFSAYKTEYMNRIICDHSSLANDDKFGFNNNGSFGGVNIGTQGGSCRARAWNDFGAFGRCRCGVYRWIECRVCPNPPQTIGGIPIPCFPQGSPGCLNGSTGQSRYTPRPAYWTDRIGQTQFSISFGSRGNALCEESWSVGSWPVDHEYPPSEGTCETSKAYKMVEQEVVTFFDDLEKEVFPQEILEFELLLENSFPDSLNCDQI